MLWSGNINVIAAHIYSEMKSRNKSNIVLTLAINAYTSNKKRNQRDIFTQEITPLEIGQMVAKVKLLIVACITALIPIIYNSVYSDLIATH